eukprot:TRINITY_DN1651_c0_g3_i1.p2 TRINITY_DN1651_c0_g3~~TRINITY_DN1651_c0_g3_i1.p2  ORF type:complete len:207 (+),score=86.90 TRINITY_DN1651_c0_g3_i1:73-693(+)
MAADLPKLTYFNGRGLAEPIRLILAEAGVEYTDVRVNSLDELKASGALPMGQVPILEIDGMVLCQSNAIGRYLGNKFGFIGANAKENYQIDALADALVDVRVAFSKYRIMPEDKQEETKAQFAAEVLPVWLARFEKVLLANNNGQGFAVGDNLTWVDFYLFNNLSFLRTAIPGCLDNTPTLNAYVDRIAERPKIAAWIAARPVTPW